jgi:polyisoprenoid-binding protein YceI
VTKEVALDVEGPTPEVLDIWGERRIGATATTVLDRRDFGIVYNRLLEGGGAVIGDQVTITIELELTRKAKE